MLWEWHLSALSENVELLVSELVTNAVHASAETCVSHGGLSAGVELCLACDHRSVLILVRDSCPGMPTRRDADPDAESGRGLQLVEHLSTRWGSYLSDTLGDKVVWALVTQATM
jgi:two-component sensor histidine kinase